MDGASSKRLDFSLWARIDRWMMRAKRIGKHNCWLWPGHVDQNGYGKLHVGGTPKQAHRLSYEHFRGPIPQGMVVMHICDVRACVNPDHLQLGSHQDNMDDAKAKGRMSGWSRKAIEPRLVRLILNHPGTWMEAAKAAGVSRMTVARVKRRARQARA